jgi:hypothetical protein
MRHTSGQIYTDDTKQYELVTDTIRVIDHSKKKDHPIRGGAGGEAAGKSLQIFIPHIVQC